jgi:hypothetical protein
MISELEHGAVMTGLMTRAPQRSSEVGPSATSLPVFVHIV